MGEYEREKGRITHYTPVLENGHERYEGLCVLCGAQATRSASYSV